MRQVVIMAVLLLVLLNQSASALAAAGAEDGTLEQVGYGVGSVFGTLVYGPLKGAVCILGAIASVPTLVFAGSEKAGNVVGAACRGTWVITPDVIKGKQPIEVIGSTPER